MSELGNPDFNFHQDGGIRHLNQLFVHQGRKGRMMKN